MSSYFIRRLTAEDEQFLWEMLYAALHVPEGQPPFSREVVNEPGIARYVLHWGKGGDTGFVAVDAADLITCRRRLGSGVYGREQGVWLR